MWSFTTRNFVYDFAVLIIFRVSRRRREMYSGHGRLSVCLSVSRRIPALLYGPGCNLGEWYRRCPIVVQYWADLQSVHGFCCYDSIALCSWCT